MAMPQRLLVLRPDPDQPFRCVGRVDGLPVEVGANNLDGCISDGQLLSTSVTSPDASGVVRLEATWMLTDSTDQLGLPWRHLLVATRVLQVLAAQDGVDAVHIGWENFPWTCWPLLTDPDDDVPVFRFWFQDAALRHPVQTQFRSHFGGAWLVGAVGQEMLEFSPLVPGPSDHTYSQLLDWFIHQFPPRRLPGRKPRID